MKTVIIMRGPSGAGKSTWIDNYTFRGGDEVEKLQHEVMICSADHYFEDPTRLVVDTGKSFYNFDPSKLQEAHASCMKKFIEAIAGECKTIILDNNNIRKHEYCNYELLARTNG